MNSVRHMIAAFIFVVAALPLGVLWTNAQQKETSQFQDLGQAGTKKTPKWLLTALAEQKVQLAPACGFESGYTAMDVGRGRATSESHCSPNCYAHALTISPSPVVGNINQPLTITFYLDGVLGGPNAVCGSNGNVDWGDGTSTEMPSDPWTNCDGKPGLILHDTVGKPPNYPLTHTYGTAGEYCVSARVWGNHKYHGDGSCSYDCTSSGNAIVVIR